MGGFGLSKTGKDFYPRTTGGHGWEDGFGGKRGFGAGSGKKLSVGSISKLG